MVASVPRTGDVTGSSEIDDALCPIEISADLFKIGGRLMKNRDLHCGYSLEGNSKDSLNALSTWDDLWIRWFPLD